LTRTTSASDDRGSYAPSRRDRRVGLRHSSSPRSHAFWDQRCAECRGHAAFARRFLSAEDGELRGRRPAGDLRLFLRNHGVPAGEVEAVYAMLLAQASGEPRFKSKCAGCRGSAAELARGSRAVRDGVLHGRRTGRPVDEFLDSHADLGTEEVSFFAELLVRVEQEVHRS
jgi:hypothetical protein